MQLTLPVIFTCINLSQSYSLNCSSITYLAWWKFPSHFLLRINPVNNPMKLYWPLQVKKRNYSLNMKHEMTAHYLTGSSNLILVIMTRLQLAETGHLESKSWGCLYQIKYYCMRQQELCIYNKKLAFWKCSPNLHLHTQNGPYAKLFFFHEELEYLDCVIRSQWAWKIHFEYINVDSSFKGYFKIFIF